MLSRKRSLVAPRLARGRVHQRRHPVRRDHPPEELRRDAARRGPPDQGIIPGIKVDTGAKPLAGSPEETVTEGLDGLRDRLAEYHGMGARFAKWRAVIHITDDSAEPSPA